MQHTYSPTAFKPKTPYAPARAITTIRCPELDGEGKEAAVKIETHKHRDGIVTTAHLVHTEQHQGYSTECTLIFGNGMQALTFTKAPRVTEKAVQQQHAAALAATTPAQIVALVKAKLEA